MRLDKNQQAFFTLLQAGLWADVNLNHSVNLNEKVDWDEVYRLASEQSVLGLVLAGIDCLPIEQKPPKLELLQWIGEIQIMEQQNRAMNDFIARLFMRLKEENVYAVLVKGQGVAQCYDNPLWRSCGDVDLLLDNENFDRAKSFLSQVGSDIHEENPFDKHFSLTVEEMLVELHGTLRGMLAKNSDDGIDAVQEDTLKNKKIREWKHLGTSIPLPCPDNDVIFVFTHILKHFFHYGIGIRQMCDLSRLLWTYNDSLDYGLLESRLRKMGLMSEWMAFGTVAVEYLGMPAEAMPFYSQSTSWKRKAGRIISFVMETGNFGHNRDSSYYAKYPGIVVQLISLWRHTCDSARHFLIFPVDAIKIWCRMVGMGISDAFRK